MGERDCSVLKPTLWASEIVVSLRYGEGALRRRVLESLRCIIPSLSRLEYDWRRDVATVLTNLCQ